MKLDLPNFVPFGTRFFQGKNNFLRDLYKSDKI